MFKNGEQFEGVRRLAGDTYDELCVCCADSMPELESKLQQLNIPAVSCFCSCLFFVCFNIVLVLVFFGKVV